MTAFLRTLAWHPKTEDAELVSKIEKISKEKQWSISKVVRNLCVLGLKYWGKKK